MRSQPIPSGFAGRGLLALAGACALTAVLFAGPALTTAGAQSQASEAAIKSTGIEGTWQGTLSVGGRDLRTVIKISRAGSTWNAMMYSIDQGPQGFPSTTFTFQGATLKFVIGGIGATYEGELSADGSAIAGTFTQGQPAPLNLKRTTPETAWAIPEAPAALKPMAPDATPGVEVATIKLSDPGMQGSGFRIGPRRLNAINNTLITTIAWAYEIHPQQISGAAAWAATDKFDIVVQPDGEGQPSYHQWKVLMQRLLADRFQLTFHHDKKEFSVFALTVAKGGPKLTPTAIADPNAQPGLFLRGPGTWPGSNVSMHDFAVFMQRAVLNRPVVDQTGLTGRYDFLLEWTPDETLAGTLAAAAGPPPGADRPNAPPTLFTAIQQELGLKLESTKAPIDVLVIDKVAKPSGN